MPPRTRKKPHPRSLDVLFPRPKVKRCIGGHSQTPEWRPMHGCSTCCKEQAERAEQERMAAGGGAAERERWRSRLGPAPAVLEMRVVDTGRLIRFVIPRHLQRRRGKARR